MILTNNRQVKQVDVISCKMTSLKYQLLNSNNHIKMTTLFISIQDLDQTYQTKPHHTILSTIFDQAVQK